MFDLVSVVTVAVFAADPVWDDRFRDGLFDRGRAWAMLVADADIVGFDAPTLCISGDFRFRGPDRVDHVVAWDGLEWRRLGSGFPARSLAMGAFGASPDRYLYVSADMNDIPGGPETIHRYDGESWAALYETDGSVYELRELEVAGESGFYAAGLFRTIGGVECSKIARFDGKSWHPIGDGMDFAVYSIASFDDGTGAVLIAGGDFTQAGSAPARNIAQWDGTDWSPLGDGLDPSVGALAVFDDGTGPALYVGGRFDKMPGLSPGIVRWDGEEWSPVGDGTDGGVNRLVVHDDGRGPALFLGGYFDRAGPVAARHIARFDGSTWETLGAGLDSGSVSSFASFDDPFGPALYAGGGFLVAGTRSSTGLARWGNPRCVGDVNADGVVDFADLISILRAWGPCSGCPEDQTVDAVVNRADLDAVQVNWGTCP